MRSVTNKVGLSLREGPFVMRQRDELGQPNGPRSLSAPARQAPSQSSNRTSPTQVVAYPPTFHSR
jgi:hypothetical protein